MRAVLIKDGKGPVENLYIGEAPTPTLQPSQVLVKVRRPNNLRDIAFDADWCGRSRLSA
jgi:hypothetical protein